MHTSPHIWLNPVVSDPLLKITLEPCRHTSNDKVVPYLGVHISTPSMPSGSSQIPLGIPDTSNLIDSMSRNGIKWMSKLA